MSQTSVDFTQLPFLLRLLDDDSPQVRRKVTARLRLYGPEVVVEIERQGMPLTPGQRAVLAEIFGADGGPGDAGLHTAWLEWQRLPGEAQRLETALTLLADWQLGYNHPVRLRELLDSLTMEFMSRGGMPDYADLSHFLFSEKGLRGDTTDYYNPFNSNLIKVIELKHGLPISLASVFILVGKRLDLVVHGCNFPGHFLARVSDGDDDLVFDCFNGGRLLQRAEVAALRKAAPVEMETPASARTMVVRTLHNLATAYHQCGDHHKINVIHRLVAETEETEAEPPMIDADF